MYDSDNTDLVKIRLHTISIWYLAQYRRRDKRETSKFIVQYPSLHRYSFPAVRRCRESVDGNFFISRPPTRLVWSFLRAEDCAIPFINDISFAEPCLPRCNLPSNRSHVYISSSRREAYNVSFRDRSKSRKTNATVEKLPNELHLFLISISTFARPLIASNGSNKTEESRGGRGNSPTMAAVITFTRSLAIHIFSRKHVSHFWEGDRNEQKGEEPVQRLANPFHRVLLREIARPSQRSD